jgi:hypothetical protein
VPSTIVRAPRLSFIDQDAIGVMLAASTGAATAANATARTATSPARRRLLLKDMRRP